MIERQISQRDVAKMQEIRHHRLQGFQKLNKLSFLQIMCSCPLFIVGVVTLVMALPHVEYPVFNFGPVVVSILVFPMALMGLLATRKATETLNVIETTTTVKCMIVCNFVLSVLCSLITAVSTFYSFYIVEQCSDMNSEYYELCLPNSRANIRLSVVDGTVCLILLLLSVLGVTYFGTHGFRLCFPSSTDDAPDDINLPSLRPRQSATYPLPM